MSEAADRHNTAVKPVLAHVLSLVGTRPVDLLVFAETMVCGLFLLIVRLGGDEPVLEVFTENVRQRLAEQRLAPLKIGGKPQ